MTEESPRKQTLSIPTTRTITLVAALSLGAAVVLTTVSLPKQVAAQFTEHMSSHIQLSAWYSTLLSKHYADWKTRAAVANAILLVGPAIFSASYYYATGPFSDFRKKEKSAGIFRLLGRIMGGSVIFAIAMASTLFLPMMRGALNFGLVEKYAFAGGVMQILGLMADGLIAAFLVSDISQLIRKIIYG